MKTIVSPSTCSIILVVAATVSGSATARADVGPAWCTHPGAMRVNVDLNSDRVIDAFCFHPDGGKWAAVRERGRRGNGGLTEVPMPTAMSSWCTHDGAELLVGDVNGDGRADLVCKDPFATWLAFSYGPADYRGTDTRFENNWCTHAGTTVSLGDQDHDGDADLICSGTDGWAWIDRSNRDWLPFDAVTDAGGRQSPDFVITHAIATFSGTFVTVVNRGSPGRVTRIGCNNVERFDNVSIPAGQSTTITLRAPVTSDPLNCVVRGVGDDGLAELNDSNNEFRL
jgi:hypothetical protein